ncbi:MAG: 3'-5' exonuclease [Proteobacteria bacterium]|nr:3'-5' exonuclease [Pseudomonadota bacterium]MCP4918561.1 3'-5' exonuclease [Pseudomonadota bacterium]
MKWKELRIVGFDTETTGFNPFDDDRIIEFAAVTITVGREGRVLRVDPYHSLFNPDREIPAKVTTITGITDDDVADAPRFEEKVDEINRVMSGGIAVAHNYAFDRNFLSMEFERAGVVFADPFAELDTLLLSRQMFQDVRGHKLEDLCKRLDVILEGAHRATNDAEACGRAFVELARRRGAPDDLQGLLDWADALGHPPVNDWIAVDPRGRIAIKAVPDLPDQPTVGDPVEHHPIWLHWMTMARERRDGRWAWRFPESLRRWCDRFLRFRASGATKVAPKTFGPGDWTIDSLSLPLP